MAQPQISSSSAPVRLLGCTNASELATGELEDKLRLLDLHRHTAMERCNQFLSEMEAAMQRAEEHREASSRPPTRVYRLTPSPASANYASGHHRIPSSSSQHAASELTPCASPSWLADVSYYKSPRLSSSSLTSRRRATRRRSWAAGSAPSGCEMTVAAVDVWAAQNHGMGQRCLASESTATSV